MNIVKPSSLICCLLALSACAPLPPASPYYEARPVVHEHQVVVLERPHVRLVYPLMRDTRYPAGTAFYEDPHGNRVAVYPDPEEFHRHR